MSKQLFDLAKQLISIESISGNEAAMADFLEDYLAKADFQVQSQPVAPKRRNLFAATHENPTVVFCTHIDTVPPFIAVSEDEHWIFGRGACDTKGIIAAMLMAGQRLRSQGIHEFGYLFVVGEEVDSIGAKVSNQIAGRSRYILVGEPTGNKLASGHKGIVSFTLTAKGVACHSAFPELGDSAIDKLLETIARLRKIDFVSDPELGACTINVGKIAGGSGHNIVPDEASATVSIRIVSPTETVLRKVNACLSDGVDLELFVRSEPQKTVTLPGFETTIISFSTDIPQLKNWGKPLLLGPGDCRVAHTSGEKILKTELEAAVEVYVDVVTKLL